MTNLSTTVPNVQARMQELKCCVLVPTYNNAKTLKRVLDGILLQTSNIIVINDGATDRTAEVLAGYNQIHQIQLPENKGKGNALKVGFAEAVAHGYEVEAGPPGRQGAIPARWAASRSLRAGQRAARRPGTWHLAN